MPNSKTKTHGKHQEIHIGDFKRDRLGVLSGSAQRHRPENYDSIDVRYLQVGAAPTIAGITGLPCVFVVRSYDAKNAMAIYTYTFEGTEAGYEFGDHEMTYELDISMSEDPIETHVNFTNLKKKYGWLASKRQFAEFMPETQTGGGLSGETAKSTRSDLYGSDSYLAVGAHYKINFAAREVPAWATARINEIVKTPRGIERFKLPAWARKRNWLCLGPHAIDRGNVSQVEVNYLLSGPRGWNKDVYGAGKLGGSDGESGLSTGTLTTGSL